MTETLGDLLRRSADSVPEPRLDPAELVAEAGRRQRRRRILAAAAATAMVSAVAVGAYVVRNDRSQELEPAPSPSPSPPSTVAVDTASTRPLVYAEGRTVHVGDRSVEAEEPVAFIEATDDGVVYEAALDCTLWFTDGTTTSVIGTSWYTAAPTAHYGSVVTGDSGSLVVWADAHSCKNPRAEQYVVYDTARREVVGHIDIPSPDDDDTILLYVDEDQVYFTSQGLPGCWVYDSDIHDRCDDPHLFRYDVESGKTTKILLSDLDDELRTRARIFVADLRDGSSFHALHQGALFVPAGRHLVPADASILTRTDGTEVRLRLPEGWTAPGPGPEGFDGTIYVSQWLDDDTVAIVADDGGGDLPAKRADLLVCRLPDGACRVAVARSDRPYVAPYRWLA